MLTIALGSCLVEPLDPTSLTAAIAVRTSLDQSAVRKTHADAPQGPRKAPTIHDRQNLASAMWPT
jgi:hypothetical protein